MTVHRVHYFSNYTILPTALLQDNMLSFEGRGLIAYLFTFGKGWEAELDRLQSDPMYDCELRDAPQVRSLMKQLWENGGEYRGGAA